MGYRLTHISKDSQTSPPRAKAVAKEAIRRGKKMFFPPTVLAAETEPLKKVKHDLHRHQLKQNSPF